MSVLPPLFYIMSILLGFQQDMYFEDIDVKIDLTKNQGVFTLQRPKMNNESKFTREDSLKLYQKAPFHNEDENIQVEKLKIIPKKSLIQIKFKTANTKKIYEMLQLIKITQELMQKMPPKYESHIQVNNLVMAIPRDRIKGKIKTNGKTFYDDDEKMNFIIWSKDIQEIEFTISTPFYHGEQYVELKE